MQSDSRSNLMLFERRLARAPALVHRRERIADRVSIDSISGALRARVAAIRDESERLTDKTFAARPDLSGSRERGATDAGI
jgi:hypothetical protein